MSSFVRTALTVNPTKTVSPPQNTAGVARVCGKPLTRSCSKNSSELR